MWVLRLHAICFKKYLVRGAVPLGLLPGRIPQGRQARLKWEAVAWCPVPASLLPSSNSLSPLLLCPALISLPFHLSSFPWILKLPPLLLSPAEAKWCLCMSVTRACDVPAGLIWTGLMCMQTEMLGSRFLSGSLPPPSGLHILCLNLCVDRDWPTTVPTRPTAC